MLIDLLTNLIPVEKRKLWSDYLQFVAAESGRFEYSENKIKLNEDKLRLLEKAMRRDAMARKNILARLQKEFVNENLSISLLTDWLIVWRYTSVLKPPLNEKRFSDIIGAVASPITRMIMALNNENPSIYLPFISLISAVIFLHLTKEKSMLLTGIKWSLKQRRSKYNGWLKNARLLLNIVSSKRLKFKIALLLNKLLIYEKFFKNNKQFEIGILDEAKIFLYSIWQFITIRHKSVIIRGL